MPILGLISCDRLALLAYPPIQSKAAYTSHPRRLWALRPGSIAVSGSEPKDKIKAAGFRGPLVEGPRTPDETLILILGDSVTFGFGLPYNQTVGAILPSRINEFHPGSNVKVINASVPGYGLWQHLDVLRSEGLTAQPQIVIYAF